MFNRFQESDFLIGLEIHQQLLTTRKLFCDCLPIDDNNYKKKIIRKLRLSKGELGEYDKTAIFENFKSNNIIYNVTKNSCLVEEDEEPPHNLDNDAKEIVLMVATNLNSNIFDELHIMRKTVIDGSNTAGFQRTLLISNGGYIKIKKKKIGIKTICLEEDAARLVDNKNGTKTYSLDRLGIPLIEITLEPIHADPVMIKDIAFHVGMLLRATKKVRRGIGTIRQDVNISIKNGPIVEIKGVQKLEQLEDIINYEIGRQKGLLLFKDILEKRNIKKISINDVTDITDLMIHSKSKIIQDEINKEHKIKFIKLEKMNGMFIYEYYNGIRFGKEISHIAQSFGIGGIIHSDELPNKEIDKQMLQIIKSKNKIKTNDAFIIIAGNEKKIMNIIFYIINRIEEAKKNVPAETRMATQSGKTMFLRPKAGSARMYPETDLIPIYITKENIIKYQNNKFGTWEETIKKIKKRYGLNLQLSNQIFDSKYWEIFTKICINKNQSPNFVASVLCSIITKLEREGMNSKMLSNNKILEVFDFLAKDQITKESIEDIFRKIITGKKINEIIKKTKIDDNGLNKILDHIIKKNIMIIKKEKKRSINVLMGIAMKELRGEISGKQINQVLQKKIQTIMNREESKL